MVKPQYRSKVKNIVVYLSPQELEMLKKIVELRGMRTYSRTLRVLIAEEFVRLMERQAGGQK